MRKQKHPVQEKPEEKKEGKKEEEKPSRAKQLTPVEDSLARMNAEPTPLAVRPYEGGQHLPRTAPEPKSTDEIERVIDEVETAMDDTSVDEICIGLGLTTDNPWERHHLLDENRGTADERTESIRREIIRMERWIEDPALRLGSPPRSLARTGRLSEIIGRDGRLGLADLEDMFCQVVRLLVTQELSIRSQLGEKEYTHNVAHRMKVHRLKVDGRT